MQKITTLNKTNIKNRTNYYYKWQGSLIFFVYKLLRWSWTHHPNQQICYTPNGLFVTPWFFGHPSPFVLFSWLVNHVWQCFHQNSIDSFSEVCKKINPAGDGRQSVFPEITVMESVHLVKIKLVLHCFHC